MHAIELNNVSKRFANDLAVDNVSLSVNEGELFGLIGPDGAGKTTLFRILTSLLLPDSGTARVCSLDTVSQYQQLRASVGYMPGRFSLYADLTIAENIDFFSSIFGVDIHDNLDLIAPIYKQIEPFSNRRAGRLSGGMKQKLALCCALIHRPKVLFLDEPTTGVDAVSRREFWDMLSDIKRQGITIFVSTPYMDEAYRCERIALIDKGKILGIASPRKIAEQYPDRLYAISGNDTYRLLLASRRLDNVVSCYPFGETLHLAARPPFDKDKAIEQLRKDGLGDVIITEINAGIEDVFIQLMSKP